MRKYNLLFFSALLFLFACKWAKTPDGILPEDKMINVMTAIHIVDGSLYNLNAPNTDSLYKYGYGRYVMLFKRYHTDSAQFKTSLRYYTKHPDQLEAMYNQIVKNLQDKADSVNKPPKPIKPQNALPKK